MLRPHSVLTQQHAGMEVALRCGAFAKVDCRAVTATPGGVPLEGKRDTGCLRNLRCQRRRNGVEMIFP